MSLLLACNKREASAHECTCSVLTDTDGTTSQVVEVCETAQERAEAAARGCAQSGAPASVLSCTCAPISGAACHAGDCKVREHR